MTSRITVRIDDEHDERLDQLVEAGIIENRSEGVRQALGDFLDEQPDVGEAIVADGGIAESFETFTDPATDPDRACQRCGDVVERRYLEERVCVGCRYGGASR